MDKSKPILKLEKIVIDALMCRGMQRGEAESCVARLESLSDEIAEYKASRIGDGIKVSGCVIVAETHMAYLMQIGEHEVWIPKSQIRPKPQFHVSDDPVTIIIPQWLARAKDLV